MVFTKDFIFHLSQMAPFLQWFLVFMEMFLDYFKKGKLFNFKLIWNLKIKISQTLRCTSEAQKNKLLKTHSFVAGCSGGFVQAMLSCPIEVVKIRLQTLGYIGRSYDCMKYIFKHEGLRGLYRVSIISLKYLLR